MSSRDVAVRELPVPVVAVTVLEDRAQVTRRARVELPAGPSRLRVRGVAPVLSDRTLSVRLEGGGEAVAVTDSRVRRERHPAPVTGDASVKGRALELAAEKAAAVQAVALEAEDLRLLDQLGRMALQDVATDAAWGRVAPEQWQGWLDTVASRERGARDRVLALKARVEAIDQALADLQRQLEAAPPQPLEATVEVELEAAQAVAVTLEVSYVVPAACWRPQHTARLLGSGGAARVVLATEGCVWQHTGEDWADVELRFSTQRPSLGTRPPLLEDDTLQARDRPEKVVVEARDQEIRTTGLGVAARTAPELPGIDDGGSALTFPAPHPASVPSDGRPYRVAVGSVEEPAEEGLVLMPEKANAVLRRVAFVHQGTTPILAGPVDLLAEGGLAGRTVARFTAPGERVALGFGPDPAVRVRRTASRVDASAGLLAGKVRTEHTVTVLLSSIGTEPRTFTLTERLPVSEVEAVRVTFDREASTPGATPDENGLLAWTVTLPPGGHHTVKLRYAVERPKDVGGL